MTAHVTELGPFVRWIVRVDGIGHELVSAVQSRRR